MTTRSRCAFFFACASVLLMVASGCRPEPAGDLTLNVHVVHAYDGNPAPAIDLELERRVLENGVLNGNYQWVGSETTDAAGLAVFSFKRLNVLDYQLRMVSSDWFQQSHFIQPDDFITSTTVEHLIDATPRGAVHIRLTNVSPLNDADRIQFRTLNATSPFATCSSAWETYTGTAVDVERTCDVEADRYLPYYYIVTRNEESVETLDSIWVPRGTLTELHILW